MIAGGVLVGTSRLGERVLPTQRNKRSTLLNSDVERVGQARGNLAGGPPLTGFNFLDRHAGATDALRKSSLR
jgi:hypothetical protein